MLLLNFIIHFNNTYKFHFKYTFTWERAEKGIKILLDKMKNDTYQPDLIIGIGRSGGIIGGLVAGYLGSWPFRAINWKIDKETKDISFDTEFSIDDDYNNILLVKGATTSGDTPKKIISFMKNKFPEKDFRYAVLVKKKSANVNINYFAYEIDEVIKLP